MKKSLKVIATATLAFSMFASVAMAAETTPAPTAVTTAAAVKTSKDFADLVGKDAALLAKIDALLAKGFMDGKSETAFDIEGNMTRAEAAKLVAKIFNLTVGTETTSSFKDVDGTDASQAWAIPFIEAAKKAGIIDGMTDTTFAPKENVTLGQLATLLVKGFGKAADVKVTTPWYQGYLDVAKAAGVDLGTDGAKLATRGDLVVGSFAADAAVQSQTKASVTEAKATGVKTVTVAFNKAVDTAKAVVALTKGTQTIATTAKWSDDKKSAVLTLTDVKISEGTYTATLSGLDAAGVDKTTATFTAENEKVTKLSFVNASEKIARSSKVTIKIKAENQYGENSSLNGGNYTAYVSGRSETVKKNDDTGLLELTLNTLYKDGVSGDLTQSEIDVLPVNVFLTNSSISAQKTFKIGVEPYVTKIDLGTVKYPANKTSLSSEGDIAEVGITRYDQYGDVIPEGAIAADRTKFDAIITPYSYDTLKLKAETPQTYDKAKFELAKNTEKAGDYTVTVYVGSASATANISVKSSKVANKVEFGSFSGVIAQGDGATYIPIVAYDAEGKQLTAQEIVDNAKVGVDRFSVSISGASYNSARNGNAAIVTSGEHKGKIKIDSVTATAKGVVFVNLGIFSANVQSSVQQSFSVQDVRVPETLAVESAISANKAIVGGETTVKWYVKDQHGAKLDDSAAANSTDYKVKVTVTGATYATFSGLTGGTTVGDTTTFEFNGDQLAGFNKKELKFVATAAGKAKVTAELFKTTSSLKKLENELEVTTDTDLTYSVNAIDSLFAARDNANTPADDKELVDGTDADGLTSFDSKFAKEVKITAKNKAGDVVAIPGNRIASIASSDNNFVNAVQEGNAAKVIGYKAGKATVTVVFNAFDGSTKDVTLEVNSKSDLVTAAKVAADANITYDRSINGAGAGTGLTPIVDAVDLVNLVVTDNYGVEFKTIADINNYKAFLGVQYVVSDIQATTGATAVEKAVTVNADGTFTIGSKVTEFVLKSISGGKSASTLVVVQD